MNLIDFANMELRAAGLLNEDGGVGADILALIKVFASQPHTTDTVDIVESIFPKLINYKVLCKITSNPMEWREYSKGKYQSVRNPFFFSEDGGCTYYDSEDPTRKIIQSSPSQ